MSKSKFIIDNSLPENLPLLLKSKVETIGNLNLQGQKNSEGKFEFLTYNQTYENILSLALALKKIGVQRGDKVAIISDNRKEWLTTDMALLSLGAVDVPRGCDSMGNEIRFIISFADCKIGFFENLNQLKKVLDNYKEVPLLEKAVLFDIPSQSDFEEIREKLEASKIQLLNYQSLLTAGYEIYTSDKFKNRIAIENEMEATKSEDTATIIFTSGTTGTPKGVMLTHKNYIAQLSAVQNFMEGKEGGWWMSILPVWHSFERLAQYVAIYYSMGIAYSKPIARTLLSDMAEINPHCLCGVPRLWDALAKGVDKKMEKTGGAVYKIYRFFMKVGKAYVDNRDRVMGNICQIKKVNKFAAFTKSFVPFLCLWPLYQIGKGLVYNKIKAKFGSKFVFAISGGGSLQQETDDFYRIIGISMLNGYGMTETAPGLAFRNCWHPQNGVVGKVFPTVELKIVAENHGQIVSGEPLGFGEKGLILVRGSHIMKGYYKRPDLTEKIIDKDGWLNTGDLGLLTFDNDLLITGRAKDTIVLLGGENIEPAGIESAICTSEFVESAIIFGQDKKYLASLIVPIKDAIIKYAKENQIKFDTYEALLKLERIRLLIQKEISKKVSSENGFRFCEKISKFTLIPDSFKVGSELSAKQEMMRYKIYEKYNQQIEEMFE